MRNRGAGRGWRTLSRFALIGVIGGGAAACSTDASRLGDPFTNPFSSLSSEPSATGSLADETDTAPAPAIRTPRIQSGDLGAPASTMSPRPAYSRVAESEPISGAVAGMNPDASRMASPRIAPAAPAPKLQFGAAPKPIDKKAAEAEARKLAEAKRLAEAEARRQAEIDAKKELEARKLAETKKLADAKKAAELKAAEVKAAESRKLAEAAEARKAAEAKALDAKKSAEAKALEAKKAAEAAEAKRLAETKKAAEAKKLADAEAKKALTKTAAKDAAKPDPAAERKAEAARKAEAEAKIAKAEASKEAAKKVAEAKAAEAEAKAAAKEAAKVAASKDGTKDAAKKVAEAKAAEAEAKAAAKEAAKAAKESVKETKVAEKEPEKPVAVKVASADPVSNPVTASDANESFRWPAKGRVINGYGSGGNEGINISVPEGTPVKAAEDGTVAYAGSDVKGYGKLVLVRHTNGYVSAYAHNGELDVRPGDKVKRGQTIAKSGATGNVTSPQLHFEIRKGATPVDPIPHLASN